jgi:hypothetical protein
MNPETLLQNAGWVIVFIGVGLVLSIALLAIGLNLRRTETPKEEALPQGGTPVPNAPSTPRFSLPTFTTPQAQPAAPVDPNANEVLRVMRDKLTGRVMLDINGRRYSQLSEMVDSDVRRAFLLTMRDLQEFAGVSLSTVGAPPPTPASNVAMPAASTYSPSVAAPTQPTVSPAAKPAQAPVSDEAEAIRARLNPAPLPKHEDASHTPLKAPSMNLFKQISVSREVGAKELTPIKSVAQQIDDALQHVILGTPFAAQNLHVATKPDGGVLFEVGTSVYDSVNDIPDRTLQVVFQEAIRRWEQAQ